MCFDKMFIGTIFVDGVPDRSIKWAQFIPKWTQQLQKQVIIGLVEFYIMGDIVETRLTDHNSV